MRTQQIEEKAAVGRSKQLGAWSEFAKNLSPGDTAPRTATRLFPLTAPSSIPTRHACGRHQEESWSVLTSETGAPQTANSKAGSPHATTAASQTENGVFHTQPQHGQRAQQTTSPPHTHLPHLPALPSDQQGHSHGTPGAWAGGMAATWHCPGLQEGCACSAHLSGHPAVVMVLCSYQSTHRQQLTKTGKKILFQGGHSQKDDPVPACCLSSGISPAAQAASRAHK